MRTSQGNNWGSYKKYLSRSNSKEGNGLNICKIGTTPTDDPNYSYNANGGLGLAFLQGLIGYGQLSMALSYSIREYEPIRGKFRKYYVRVNRFQILNRLVYLMFCIHLSIPVINYGFNVSYSKLVNWIKRITFGIFVLKVIISGVVLNRETRKKRSLWVEILEQIDLLQERFSYYGIQLPSRNMVKNLGRFLGGLSVIFCIAQIMVFVLASNHRSGHIWCERYANTLVHTVTLNLWTFRITEFDKRIVEILGVVGIGMEIMCWNLWYFIDILRVFSSLIVWSVFKKINEAVDCGTLTIKNLPEIMDLHFKGIKLLNLFNQLISPITMASTLFNVFYVCFWTNYTLISFQSSAFKIANVVGIFTAARMIAVFHITAEVNTQVYAISSWLENRFAEGDQLPQVDHKKLTLLTSILYNKDAIGFKGMTFFTVNQPLNLTIAGLVLTYTFVVNQFAAPISSTMTMVYANCTNNSTPL